MQFTNKRKSSQKISAMKTLLVLSVALVCALAHQSIEDLADMNTGVSQTNDGELLLNYKSF